MPGNQIGFGVATQIRSGAITLHSGQAYIPPSGQYIVTLGPYSGLQWFDSLTQTWRTVQTPANSDLAYVTSDGYNFRVVNLTGTMVAAYLTNGGSSYPNGIYPAATTTTAQTNYVIATVSAAGAQSSLVGTLAKCNVIVGGAVSTTVTVTAAGSGFTRAPTLVFSPPPAGGVPASGYVSALSAGGIGTVVITNQGAGYGVTVPGDGRTGGTARVATLATGLAEAVGAAGMAVCVPRFATLASVFVTDGAVAPPTPVDAAAARALNASGRYASFFHELLARGVAFAPGAYEVLFCSMAHDDDAIARTLEAAHQAALAAVANGG